MYDLGSENAQPILAGKKAHRSTKKPRNSIADFDFEGCENISASVLTGAIFHRSEAALCYIADVIEDLSACTEVCSHAVNSLSNREGQFSTFVEIKRRCFTKGRYTHLFLVKPTFLPRSIRVKAHGATEQAAKQAAHVALICRICRELLMQA
ncbi:hypothetical protein [Pseudomonas sp. MWU12-2323]|uniref:hypothetical protein n=1 Tax=Pseudomonas sp. MWU12-2323 TaxID=2651296 RepID=UPI00128E4BE9|nr:hypothetical protein [Pseudomonas sp. MWU12-2323]MPQ69437.1 hypothetical protein [Pseudomonas sp. MWU12-2323]